MVFYRWLMAHGRSDEARNIIAALEAKPGSDPYVVTQMQEIEFSVKYERENSMRWRDILLGKRSETGDTKSLRRLLLGAGTQFIQQFEGINIMSYYLPTGESIVIFYHLLCGRLLTPIITVLIEMVGLSNTTARLLTAINSITYLVFSFGAVPLVERIGRRGLMLLSTAGQGVAFLIITTLLRFSTNVENGEKIAKASIAFFFLYYIAFGLGMLGVPWLYPTEINSLPMRTKGAAVATCTNW